MSGLISADALADRVRAALAGVEVVEQRMFGGIGYMVGGHMVAASSKRGLLVRIGPDRQEQALRRPGARVMEMRGRPVRGYVQLDPDLIDDAGLGSWLDEALDFARTLPPKAAKAKPKRS